MLVKDFEKISARIDTVEELLKLGYYVRIKSDTIKTDEGVKLTTIMDIDDCLVGYATYAKEGDELPNHKHVGVVQYIMQYKGTVGIMFENGGYRILRAGDCAKVNAGELHKVVALSDDAQQVFVCIPAEKGYRIEKDTILKEQEGR